MQLPKNWSTKKVNRKKGWRRCTDEPTTVSPLKRDAIRSCEKCGRKVKVSRMAAHLKKCVAKAQAILFKQMKLQSEGEAEGYARYISSVARSIDR